MIASALSLTTPTPVVRRGLIVTEHSMGARIGARVLERGGNAVGAGLATASTDGTLFVARPAAIHVGKHSLEVGLDPAAAGI